MKYCGVLASKILSLPQKYFFFRINEAWGKNQEKELIHIYLPEFVVGSRKRYAILCVRNISKFTSSISLKRKQLCHCQLKEIRASINLMNYKYDCSHRELVTMEISDTNFYVSSIYNYYLDLSTVTRHSLLQTL